MSTKGHGDVQVMKSGVLSFELVNRNRNVDSMAICIRCLVVEDKCSYEFMLKVCVPTLSAACQTHVQSIKKITTDGAGDPHHGGSVSHANSGNTHPGALNGQGLQDSLAFDLAFYKQCDFSSLSMPCRKNAGVGHEQKLDRPSKTPAKHFTC